MKYLGLFFIAFVCFFSMIKTTNAQILAWELNGAVGNEASINSTTTDANLGVSPLTRGAGLNTSALGNSFSSTNYSGTTLANAIATNQYVQFTVTPASGFKVSLSTLDDNFRRSGTGPTDFQWQYSLDGFATAGINAGAAINFTSAATNGVAQTQIGLTAIPALQNVAFPNVITFRLFGWNASATTGTFAIGRLAGNDLAIDGVTVAITTAANSEISGRVRTSNGTSLSRVTLMLSGGSLSEPIYATTNSFGIYRFEDIPVGATYVLSVMSRKYNFENSSRLIDLQDNVTDADFVTIDEGGTQTQKGFKTIGKP